MLATIVERSLMFYKFVAIGRERATAEHGTMPRRAAPLVGRYQ
jgi:hypothetical protein